MAAKKKKVVKKPIQKAKSKTKSAPPKKSPIKKSAAVKAKSKIKAKKITSKPAPKKAPPAVKKPLAKAARPAPAAKIKKQATSVVAPQKMSHLKPTAATPVKDLTDFLTPLDDRLIVRIAEAAKMTAGGLYIPDTVSDFSGNLKGQVVLVGRGHRNKKGHVRPMDVRIGDQVVFAAHSGSKINFQNEDLIILRESEVMGVTSK